VPLPHEEVVARIRRGEVAPVYVLAGEDGLPQREVWEALAARVPELGRHVFDGAVCGAGEVVAALRTAGLAQGRLVRVDEPRWLLPRNGEAKGDGADETADEGPEASDDDRPLLAYLDRPARDAVLVLRTRGALDRRRRLARKAVERGVFLATVPPRDPRPWVRARARALGLSLDEEAVELLAARCQGATLERLEQEIAKLAAYAQGAPLDREALDRLVPPSREERIYDLVDAAVGGEPRRALELAQALVAHGEPVPLILFLLARHLRTMALVAAAGRRPEDLAGALGVHPFVARKAWEQARRFGDRLAACWAPLWQAEVGFKTGRLGAEAAVAHAVLGILAARVV
jgi:DNA polymerase-3 subunit delta